MTVFTWLVLSVDVTTKILGDRDDIVTVVYWRCNGEQDGYTAYLERNSVIPYDPATYVPYADLTEAQVLDWVLNAEAYKLPIQDETLVKREQIVTVKDATEAEIQQMLDVQIAPPVVSPALPWEV